MVMKILPNILNIKNSSNEEKANAILVDRRTVWGNPFVLGRDGNRDRVCDSFFEYALRRKKHEPEWLTPLKGKNLVCWCAPFRCHADTLVVLANEE